MVDSNQLMVLRYSHQSKLCHVLFTFYNLFPLPFSTLPPSSCSNSPTLVARALIKRSNHSLLHVSGTGSTYSSSSDWRPEEDSDELTEKVSNNALVSYTLLQ